MMLSTRAQPHARTFPYATTSNVWTSGATSTNSHTVTLPAASPGDLIVCHFVTDASFVSTPATGWTKLGAQNGSYTGTLNIFYKVSDGIETTLVVSVTGSTKARALGRVIRHANSVSGASATDGGKTSYTVDPVSCTAAQSGKRYFYDVVIARFGYTDTLPSPPSGYSDVISCAGYDGNSVSLFSATKANGTTATEDPPTFTFSQKTFWAQWTLIYYYN